MKKGSLFLSFLLLLAMLTALTACGQKPAASSSQEGGSFWQMVKPKVSAAPEQAASAPGSESKPETGKITVIDAYSEEGTYPAERPFFYSYHIPEIELDAPGAEAINQEIQQLYADLVLDDWETGTGPDCVSISYEHYQNGSLLSLVLTCCYSLDNIQDRFVYHYNAETDTVLGQDDLPSFLGVSGEALQNAVTRAAAQKFDEAYYDDPTYSEQFWQQDPSRYSYYRAETLGGYYLDNALVYLGEDGQPRVFLPYWSFAGAGVAFCDEPLTLTPGKTGQLKDELLTVNWDDTGVTIRFHGDEASRNYWRDRFDRSCLLE